ncbi:MAG: hypothetical protein RLN89_10240 [Parvibaculum sp.]
MRILAAGFLAAALWTNSTFGAQADQGNSEAETNRAAENALRQTETLMTSIAFAFDYLATFVGEAGPPAPIIHAELQATTNRLDGVRSLLMIAEDGTLQHDAFSYPAPQVNLGNRDYVIAAMTKPGMRIGAAIIGRTSGFPFAPISMRKPSINTVMTAITDLRKLREPLDWCLDACGGALLTDDGKIVAISPPETKLDDDLIQKIINNEEMNGSFVHSNERISFLISFRKSERFPFIILASKALAPTTSIATE